jgi:hypothetical protein
MRDAPIFQAIRSPLKPIKALREHYITRHMATPQEVENEFKSLPVLFNNQVATVTANAERTALVAEDASVREIDAAARQYMHEQKQKGVEVGHSRAVLFVTGRVEHV